MNSLFKKIVFLLISLVWVTISYATDYTALSNNLAALPGIQPQTQGYDLLSGKVTQNVPLVKGPIPFSMQYHASLRLSSDGGVDYYQELDEGAVADWSNEYSGYIMTNITPGTNGERAFIIQLPGSSEKHIIAYQGGKWKRIYYSGSGTAPAQTFTSENMRDIVFSESNGVVTIIKDGITYTAAISKSITSFGKTDKLLKFTSIKFQDGRLLTLSYDSGVNLIEVKDNRNNKLKILREYKKAGAQNQSSLERKLITGVELISGNNTQKSTISYQETQVQSVIDPSKQETRYTLIGIQSLVAGNFSYKYESLLRGYLYKYHFNNVSSTQAGITNASTYPILVKVLDEKNNVLREWSYGNIIDIYKGTSSFKVYVTQISAFSTINGVIVNKSISAYDDLRGNFTNRFVVNGQQQAVDISIDASKLGNYYNQGDLSLMDGATVTVALNGEFPSLNSGDTPIRSVTFNPFTHRIVSMKDFNGNTSKYEYDHLNRLSKSISALDNIDAQTITYTYTKLTNGVVNRYPTPNEIVTDSQKVTNTLDQNGWISQQVISYPKGGTSKTLAYTYNTDSSKVDFGLLKNVDGPRTDINDNVSITYDSYGNRLTTTQDVNNKAVVTKYLNYNSFGQPERIIYPSGLIDKFVYNDDGTLKSKIAGNGGETGSVIGAITSYTYDYLKRKKTETSPDNEMTVYDYDILGQHVKTTLPDGTISVQTYFDNGVVKSIEGASLTYNEVNAQGRISKTRNGNVADYYWKELVYDGNGNLTQTKSALGIIEKWTYDALNRNTSYTDGEGNISTKAYDKSNNLISALDAVNSGSIPFNYVNSTLIKDEVNKDYATKSYTYNSSDQVTSKKHGNRSCNYSNIDSLGRIGRINCNSEHSTDPSYAYSYQYTYDNSRFGNLDKVSSDTSFGVDTQYSYDNLGRINGKLQTNKALTMLSGVNTSLNIGYDYSMAGKVTSILMPSGRMIQYNYDGTKDRLASINIAGNPFITNIDYDNTGQLKSWNIENGSAKFDISYDMTGDINSLSFKNSNNVNNFMRFYSKDKDGRILKETKKFVVEKGPLGNNVFVESGERFYYYNNGYLKSEETFTGNFPSLGRYGYKLNYSYDKNGNVILVDRVNGFGVTTTKNYSYFSGTNKISNIINNNLESTISYLPTGELRFASFLSNYDGSGQMRYSGGSNGQYYMAYNHRNERTTRLLSNSMGQYVEAIQFIYDENSNLIGEYTANGTPIVEYVWMGNRPVAAIYGSGAGKTYAIVTDRNATPRMLVDNSTNSVVWQWESTAFGVGLPTGSVKFNLRFPGQYYDELTGLHYNLNRFYNPDLGRYMEPDPIGLEGGLNPYAYAGNNPISNVDPSGLDYFSGGAMSYQYSTNVLIMPQFYQFLNLAANSIGIYSMLNLDTSASNSTYRKAEDPYVTVYRGTRIYSEIAAWESSQGYIMADAMRRSYIEGNDFGYAYTVGSQRHAALTQKYGGEANLALAQSLNGTEFADAPRTMFSVTTKYSVAAQFSEGGAIFSSKIDRRLLLPSPVNKKGGSEAEYFIRIAHPMMRVK